MTTIKVQIEGLSGDRYRVRRYWPDGDVETNLFHIDELREAWECGVSQRPPWRMFRRRRAAYFAALKIWTSVYHMVLVSRGECQCDEKMSDG